MKFTMQICQQFLCYPDQLFFFFFGMTFENKLENKQYKGPRCGRTVDEVQITFPLLLKVTGNGQEIHTFNLILLLLASHILGIF